MNALFLVMFLNKESINHINDWRAIDYTWATSRSLQVTSVFIGLLWVEKVGIYATTFVWCKKVSVWHRDCGRNNNIWHRMYDRNISVWHWKHDRNILYDIERMIEILVYDIGIVLEKLWYYCEYDMDNRFYNHYVHKECVFVWTGIWCWSE